MIKHIRLLFLFVLLFAVAACAERNKEKTEEKIPEQYAEQTDSDAQNYNIYTSGSSIILDWDTVRQKPLISYETFYELEDVEFLKFLDFNDYYIDYDTLFIQQTEVSGGGIANTALPNGNFLTNGESRKKLCPDPVCREDETMNCTHINLVGGHVWGNYVYYIGKYKAEEQKSDQWTAEYENYLLRYNIPENELELVARLPWYCSIVKAAYGVLYISYMEDIPNNLFAYRSHMLIYDCENLRLALADNFNGAALFDAVWANDGVYYNNGRMLYYSPYDLSSVTEIGTLSDDVFATVTLLGYARNRVFYLLSNPATGLSSAQSLKDDGRRRVVVESCADAALITEGSIPYLYALEGTEIARYTLDRVGRGENRTTVFREADLSNADERFDSVEVEHGILRVVAKSEQTDGRAYILTDQGFVPDDKRDAAETMDESDGDAAAP